MLTLSAVALGAAVASGAQVKGATDIVETAVANGSLQKLVAAIEAAGLTGTLKGAGPFTVFAPNDDAFARLPLGTLDKLLADKATLTQVLTYHVVPSKMMAADARKTEWVQTVQGQKLNVLADGGTIRINGAKVLTADIACSNGVIHVIDTVIMPPKDIIDTAVDAGSLKTLVTAVKAAGMVEMLKGAGPFTVFAPNDAAFAKLPSGTFDTLLKEVPNLTAILKCHVVPGRTLSSDLTTTEASRTIEVKTVSGQPLAITVTKDGAITVNGAKVITKDIFASNGIIHVIDTVVMPKETPKG
jgi:transforming growth factor-beta-induced protein